MRLNPKAFNRMLNDMGQRFAWRRAFACPCINPHSGAPKPGCPYCHGKGRAWGDPVEGVAGVVGRDQMREFAQFGIWDAGDVMLSIPSDSPLYDIGQFDRVVALDRSEPFSMTLVRGRNDRLREPLVEVERAYWIDDSDKIVEGRIAGIGPNGVIQWDGVPPPMGEQFSITGRRRPEYFVYQDLPFDRPHHKGAPLPRRVVLRRFDLYGR